VSEVVLEDRKKGGSEDTRKLSMLALFCTNCKC